VTIPTDVTEPAKVVVNGHVLIRDYQKVQSLQPVSDELLREYKPFADGPGWRSLLEPQCDVIIQDLDRTIITGKKVKSVGTDSQLNDYFNSFAKADLGPNWGAGGGGGYGVASPAWVRDSVAHLANLSYGKPTLPSVPKKETPVSQFRAQYEKTSEFKSVKLTKDNVRDIGAEIGKKLGGEILVGDESIGLPPFSALGTPAVELVEGDHIVEGWDYETGKPTFRVATLEERQTYDLR
jgi:hypothetical protein